MTTPTTPVYRELKNLWGDTTYRSNMDHPSFRYLLDEAIQEKGLNILQYLQIPDGVDLSKMTFIQHSFNRTNLKQANLTASVFAGCTFNNIDFTTATLMSAYFVGCRFHSCIFSKVNFASFRMENCTASYCDFSDADISYAVCSLKSLGGNTWKGAGINLSYYTMVAAVLTDAAKNDDQLVLANYPLIFPGDCWPDFAKMEIRPDLKRWALGVLLPFVSKAAGVPEFLRALHRTSDLTANDPLHRQTNGDIDTIIEDYMSDGDDDDGDDDDDEDDDDE